jgi:hypothetical protein
LAMCSRGNFVDYFISFTEKFTIALFNWKFNRLVERKSDLIC